MEGRSPGSYTWILQNGVSLSERDLGNMWYLVMKGAKRAKGKLGIIRSNCWSHPFKNNHFLDMNNPWWRMPIPYWDGQIRICGCAVGSQILCMISTLNCTLHIISQHTVLYHMLSINLLLSNLFLLSQETCCFPHLCDSLLQGFKSQKISLMECTF